MNLDELARRAQRRYPDALEKAFVECANPIRKYLVRKFGWRPNDNPGVDDGVGEVFLRAARDIGKYRGDAPIMNWLHGIARHVGRKWLRDKRKWQRKYPEAAEIAYGEQPSDEPHVIGRASPMVEAAGAADTVYTNQPLDELQQKELEQALNECLEAIRRVYGRELILYYYKNWTRIAIAAALNKPLGTVNGDIPRAREAVRDCLKRKGFQL